MARKQKTFKEAAFERLAAWFLEYVWPQVKELLAQLVQALIAWIFERIQDVFASSRERTANGFEEKARESEERAKNSSNAQEAAEFRRIAEIWRRVTEQLIEENENLKSRLKKLGKEMTKAAEKKVDALKASDVFRVESSGTITARAGAGQKLLPDFSGQAHR